MPLMPQDLVHKAETVISGPLARVALAVIAVIALAFAYDWRQARNFSTQEAMDSAQLARNISQGKGFTTQFVRPFSMFLVKRANQERLDSLPPEKIADLCNVKGDHPDLANAPGYPMLLAGWMKILPFHFDPGQKPGGPFTRHQPDFLIIILNQIIFIATVLAVFFLARKIFDAVVAWISAILLFGAEILWRFSASGNSTMLLLLLFVLLVWALVKFESVIADVNATQGRVLTLALLLGALLGVGMLTRYAYGVLIVPVAVYLFALAGRRRLPALMVVLLAFGAIVAPWIARNMAISGMPFGTATYAPIENSLFFPQHRLERSLIPNLAQIPPLTIWWKLFTNLRLIVGSELPRLGGGWVTAFFVAGLMVNFRNPVLGRLRWFTLGSLAMLVLAQALGRTALSDDAPEINSENLLVLLLPLLVIYGASFFYALLDQLRLPGQMMVPLLWIRRTVIGVFVIVCTLPLIVSFLPGRTTPMVYPSAVAFPPYYPPDIQKVSNWMNPDELVMSDVPWAVAWYGNRQSAWLTLDSHLQFFTLTDYIKPVHALYLSPQFLDARYFSDWVVDRYGEGTWGDLVILATAEKRLPDGFPLVKSYRLNGQLFFSDWERWLKPNGTPANP